MADRIKGITIELDGDTTKLSNALKGVNKEIRDTQSNLKDVNKLLKMDPGNADLLAQKQKYLTEAIDATKKKLAEEKEALAQLKAGPQTEETKKQQEALTREIEATKQSLEGLEDEYKKFGSVAGQQLQVAGDKMKEVGGKISDVGEGLTKGITVPVAAVGAASVAAWKEVDEALDAVTQKTGASGAALEDMQKRAKSIAETIPTDFQTAGDAVGEVNTRFGLTGDALEDLSKKFVEFASLNSTDVSTSVDNVSSVLNAFGQSSDDAGNLLDALNQVGQATGVSMDTLSQDLSKNAAQFQAMGLSAEQAAGFMGAVEMSGLDTSTMLTGLTKAQKTATKNGQSLSDALKDFSKTMNSNASDTEKLQAAYDLFGSRAGGAIYNAVQSGKLSLSDLSTTLGDYAGSVESTFNETLDPLDQMTVTVTLSEDGSMTLSYIVSSEQNYDWLHVLVDGTEVLKKSGTGVSTFTEFSYALAAGAHTIVLRYTKDGSQSRGNDACGIGYLLFTGVEPPYAKKYLMTDFNGKIYTLVDGVVTEITDAVAADLGEASYFQKKGFDTLPTSEQLTSLTVGTEERSRHPSMRREPQLVALPVTRPDVSF